MTAKRLQGKRVLVTAAGQGIGRATVLAMAAEEAQVFATDVNAQTLSTLKGVETFDLDAHDNESMISGVARANPIAALVVYLASDASAFTTGHPHIIDGGWSGQ